MARPPRNSDAARKLLLGVVQISPSGRSPFVPPNAFQPVDRHFTQ
jgi:hypothetical protein